MRLLPHHARRIGEWCYFARPPDTEPVIDATPSIIIIIEGKNATLASAAVLKRLIRLGSPVLGVVLRLIQCSTRQRGKRPTGGRLGMPSSLFFRSSSIAGDSVALIPSALLPLPRLLLLVPSLTTTTATTPALRRLLLLPRLLLYL